MVHAHRVAYPADLSVRGDESSQFRAVVAGLEVVEPGFPVVEVSLEPERIDSGSKSCLIAVGNGFGSFSEVAVGIRDKSCPLAVNHGIDVSQDVLVVEVVLSSDRESDKGICLVIVEEDGIGDIPVIDFHRTEGVAIIEEFEKNWKICFLISRNILRISAF